MNKKLPLMLLLVLLLATKSYAIDLDMALGFNIASGLNLATTSEKTLKYKGSFYGAFGLFYELGLLEFIAVQPELSFSFHKGYALKYHADGVTETINHHWSTFNLALFAKGRFFNEFLYVMLGPTLQLVTSNIIYDDSTSLVTAVAFVDSNLKRASFGAATEVGTNIPLGNGALTVGLRTQWNFTQAETYGNVKIYTHSPIALKLGYKFNLS